MQLDLAKPTDVDTVHVTFEAQSADCRVEARTDGKWKTVTRIAGSGPRRLVRHFSPVRTGIVRLVIDKPSGPPAICEIRLYHESKKGVRNLFSAKKVPGTFFSAVPNR